MKKTLFTSILACALTVSGLVLSAADTQSKVVSFNNGVFSSEVSESLQLLIATKDNVNLASSLASHVPEDKEFGFMRNGKFVSLSDAIAGAKIIPAKDSANISYISLGDFSKDETIQFGYADKDGAEFTPFSVSQVAADPGYYGGYNSDSFYQLDFSEDPFNGMFEIIIGKPLPAPAVTLLVALAAGALFLLYKNRKQRSVPTEQA